MIIEVWDVVIVPAFPNQENSSQYTSRPAIILEDLQDEVSIFPITKKLKQKERYKYCFIVKKDSEEGKEMGLQFDSLIVLDREVSVSKYRLLSKIGSCPESIIDRIEELLEQKRKDNL